MVRRSLLLIPVLLGVTVVVFVALHLAPGDPAQWLLGPTATPARLAALRAELGLDRSLPVQYFAWLSDLLHGKLGYSISFRQDAMTLVMERFRNTLYLAIPAFILSTILGLAAGIVGGLRRGSRTDAALSTAAFIGISMPAFWLGLLLILYAALKTGIFPVSSMNSPGHPATLSDTAWHMVLPVITLSVAPAAVVAQVTRIAFIEEIGKLYVRTARAKGCSRLRAALSHALRNTWMSVATTLALEITYVVGGAVLVENVFNWPGIGKLLVESTVSRDYPVVMGASLVLAVLVVVVNLVIDLLYPLLDPRVSNNG
jgi:peptide/nickel transport system permease protein